MAKMRVYELARDLNLTNKILLSKLNDMDIAVKSHMSALDDDTVATVKKQLFGKKEETIEETRIRPTVIRRRKKKVTVKPAPEPIPEPEELETVEEPAAEVTASTDAAEATETATAEAAAPEAPAVEKIKPVDEEPPKVEVELEEVPETVAKEQEPAREKPTKKVVKKVKKEESAKIIQLPVKPIETLTPERPARREKGKVQPLPAGRAAAPKPEVVADDTAGKDTKKKKWKKRGEEGDRD